MQSLLTFHFDACIYLKLLSRTAQYNAFYHVIHSYLGQITNASEYFCSTNDSSIEITLTSSPHSAWEPLSNCALALCNVSSNNICRSSETPCFDYRTNTNASYCAPGALCSIMQPCNNITYQCVSSTSVCVVNSCCAAQAVCLPLYWISLCS